MKQNEKLEISKLLDRKYDAHQSCAVRIKHRVCCLFLHSNHEKEKKYNKQKQKPFLMFYQSPTLKMHWI